VQRVVLAHSAEHIALTLHVAARLHKPVILQNPPGAAQYAGVLYLRKMLKAAAKEAPGADYIFILDCAEDTGALFAGLREGFRHFRIHAAPEVMGKLYSIAAQEGATLHEGAYEALDLLDSHHAEERLSEWLSL
jgi:hypothetical protein